TGNSAFDAAAAIAVSAMLVYATSSAGSARPCPRWPSSSSTPPHVEPNELQRSGCGDDRDARQLLALEDLERRAAAGGGPRAAAEQAELVQRADRVRAADDRERGRIGHRLGDGPRAAGECGPLEDAHRAVPEDRSRAGDRGREALARLRPDVEAEPA